MKNPYIAKQESSHRHNRLKKSSETNEKTILVTGGAGFVGKHLVRALSKNGRTVVTMYRHRLPEPMKNVYPVCTDLSSIDLLKAPLRGVDMVVYLAWDRDGYVNANQDFKSEPTSNLVALGNLIRAMEEVGTRKIAFVSAMGADRWSHTPFLREKYYGEFCVLNSKIPEKVLLRPTIIFDGHQLHDRFIRTIVNITKFPGIYPVPSLGYDLAPLHVDDLVQSIFSVIDSESNPITDIIEVVGNEKYSLDELFKIVAENQGYGGKMQVKGVLGDSFLKVCMKLRHKNSETLDIRKLLDAGRVDEPNYLAKHTYKGLVPNDFKSFRTVLGARACPQSS